ncbi:cytochrome c oxidase assembly factor 4 homolog, mitochondrial [Olea europaea var. sylvestris]|uniref:Cytochrome c oxidase assembly factor 4 homolog, mitochondrial n=1 Tax=Olea europaea subsp. europaea TaxID=158383 RepID=A0A8S0RCB5_OLEEU|nr:cytochrome c oxidase assembly factor 4 homolog, mitochondrial [Olea europaea var. sylvestris]XP_022874716.1 cytochrome c oxidase assembly factor 4 homolog, mitochondrial [Olea europaea var. sylvestris]XP_022874717.1 cytochrome c oxidase assembly factor 4 homolog, mitochondrial [Olea europaea var. sylvestris]XP_022874719.1 cytochrome c oxidase assembly factor 4 homolog, mitochondrial [Olea europaea var. sylvestris]XP_022874720.1 cytochrome c oxidase assembly factor 4 homolog, mitochondrial [O
MDKPHHSSPNPSQASPPPPPVRHQSDMEEDDETVKQLKECSSLYLALQDCLIKTNRNWKSCQLEVQALKECNDRRKKEGQDELRK